jgi:hypothetical protein
MTETTYTKINTDEQADELDRETAETILDGRLFLTYQLIQHELDVSYYVARKLVQESIDDGVIELVDKSGYATDKDKSSQ